MRLRYEDKNGIWMPTEHHTLKARVENGTLMGLCSANAYVRGNYTDGKTETYYGEALAVVRAGVSGEVTLSVYEDEGDRSVSRTLPII